MALFVLACLATTSAQTESPALGVVAEAVSVLYSTGSAAAVAELSIRQTASNYLILLTASGLTPSHSYALYFSEFGDLSRADGSFFGNSFSLTGNSQCPSLLQFNTDSSGTATVSTSRALSAVSISGANSVIGRGVFLATRDSSTACTPRTSKAAIGVVGVADLAGNTASSPGSATGFATCLLKPTSLAILSGGLLTFQDEGSDQVTAVADLTLDDNAFHGLSIHEYGDLRSNTGAKLGVHWNPTSTLHGGAQSSVRHLGDLGNYDGSDPAGYRLRVAVPLTSSPNPIGRSVAVHETTDDGFTQPDGNALGVLAQCVIGYASADGGASTPTPAPQKGGGSNTNTIIMAAVFGSIGALLLGLGAVYWYRRRGDSNESIWKTTNKNTPFDNGNL